MMMLDQLARIPRKLSIVLNRRDADCSIPKALADIWTGHRRPERIARMRHRMKLLSRDESGCELWRTPIGEFWIPAGGGLDTILCELDDGVYASRSGRVDVRAGDIVVDCGAHVGSFCRNALQRGAEHVVAVEISPETRVCLERNLRGEIDQGRVTIVADGVWSEQTVLRLNMAAGSLSNTLVDARGAFVSGGPTRMLEVPVTTLDALAAGLGLARVDFVKMDVEGAEREALRGAREVLKRFRPRLAIAAYHLPDDREEIPASIRAAEPEYQEELGQCLILHDRVIPETLFYH